MAGELGSQPVNDAPSRAAIGIVVIGRDEGDRLMACLGSLDPTLPIVYVDSGSIDGSPARARRTGVHVIELDPATGFSAARGRNAGLDYLLQTHPDLAFVQMIDGDCTLAPRWLTAGMAAMAADPATAAMFGRCRERYPARSVYNWLCDVEWATQPGPVRAFAGNVMLRVEALTGVGRYRNDLIAGEEPDLSIRFRQAGWQIQCIDAEMVRHDAAIHHFGQWWQRAERAGHAFAELSHLHPEQGWHDYHKACRRITFWGGIIPTLAGMGLLLGLLHIRTGRILFIGALLLVLAQILRLTIREMRYRQSERAITLAFFLTLGKLPEMIGMTRFHGRRLLGRAPALIEHKRRAAG